MSYDPGKRRGRVEGHPGLWWRETKKNGRTYELKFERGGLMVSNAVRDQQGRLVQDESTAIEAWKAMRAEDGLPLFVDGPASTRPSELLTRIETSAVMLIGAHGVEQAREMINLALARAFGEDEA